MKNIFLKYWLPLYLYAGIIFYLSSQPLALPKTQVPFFDKWLHVVEYTVFGMLAVRAFRHSSQKILIDNLKIMALLISIIYGISDEIHQAFVPGRDCNVFDLMADSIGSLIGVFTYGRYSPFQGSEL